MAPRVTIATMGNERRDRGPWLPRLIGAIAIASLALAPAAAAAPRAKSSASVKKQVKKLKKKFNQLQAQLDEVSKQAGPQGPPGLPGEQGPPGQQGQQGTPGSANAWALAGNAGTTGANFLGTTDDQALNARVNNARALRLEPASDGTNQSPNVIGGIADNAVTAGVHSATISGGGRDTPANPATANRVTDDGGTVGGGVNNQAGDGSGTGSDRTRAAVGGGESNTASGHWATVAGGQGNSASGTSGAVGGGSGNDADGIEGTVGGGGGNTASGLAATVGGGSFNVASGSRATVPGGRTNVAQGEYSLAAGRRAKANHDGAFVWADSTNTDIASSEDNQFIARAAGGFFLQDDSSLDDQGGFINTSTEAFLSTTGVWQSTSDEDLKQDFEEIDPEEVLDEVAELPVTSWAYKANPEVRHIGPTGQDFYAAFGIGEDERSIGTVDADGVALAAIKGLNARVEGLERELAELRAGD